MSYDIALYVKTEGCGKYVKIEEPECSHPTYNLGGLFRSCMGWDYKQTMKDDNGEYETCYYNCEEVIEHVEKGIKNLRLNPLKEYYDLLPENGWGTMSGAIETLESLRKCIYQTVEDYEIPINCLWMAW